MSNLNWDQRDARRPGGTTGPCGRATPPGPVAAAAAAGATPPRGRVRVAAAVDRRGRAVATATPTAISGATETSAGPGTSTSRAGDEAGSKKRGLEDDNRDDDKNSAVRRGGCAADVPTRAWSQRRQLGEPIPRRAKLEHEHADGNDNRNNHCAPGSYNCSSAAAVRPEGHWRRVDPTPFGSAGRDGGGVSANRFLATRKNEEEPVTPAPAPAPAVGSNSSSSSMAARKGEPAAMSTAVGAATAATAASMSDPDGGRDDEGNAPPDSTAEDWDEKLLSQYRFRPMKEQLPAEAFVPVSEEVVEDKGEAADHAIEAVVAQMRKDAENEIEFEREDEDEGISSEDEYYSMGRSRRPEDRFPYSREQIEKFFGAVVHCLPLTLGFDVFGNRSEDYKNCHCPCDANLLGWREQFHLEMTVAGKGQASYCSKGKLTPIGIMSHLRKEGERCILHYGLVAYMECLYCKDKGDYRGGIGHKAMYQQNDKNWRKADAAEKRELNEQILAGRKQLAEERARRMQLETERKRDKEQLDLLRRTNEDHYKRIQELEKDRTALRVEKKEAAPELSSSTLRRYQRAFATFFEFAKNIARTKVEKNEDPLIVAVDQSFDLQDFFDRCYDQSQNSSSRKNASLLFSSLDSGSGKRTRKNAYSLKIINKWDVRFKNEASGAKDDTAIDDGAPTREFLSQCWRQMGSLRLKIGGALEVALFEDQLNGVVPMTDDKLRSQLKAKMKCSSGDLSDASEYKGFIDRANAYYRAIGRIMLHALANGHTIASSAMPPLYLNWLLRGCSPEDDDYHKDDVLKHLIAGGNTQSFHALVGIEYEFEDGTTEVLSSKTIFTKLIPEQYLGSRRTTLGAIKEGLTLDGDCIFPLYLRSIPLEAVQKNSFSNPILAAEDIIAIMTPLYCVGWEGTDAESSEFKHLQEEFFKVELCGILRERGERKKSKFLSLFVKFCTGYDYLPYRDANPDFRIFVDFNFAESEQGSYPVAHACDKTLKLPGRLYLNGRDEFEEKLQEAVMTYGDRFDTM